MRLHLQGTFVASSPTFNSSKQIWHSWTRSWEMITLGMPSTDFDAWYSSTTGAHRGTIRLRQLRDVDREADSVFLAWWWWLSVRCGNDCMVKQYMIWRLLACFSLLLWVELERDEIIWRLVWYIWGEGRAWFFGFNRIACCFLVKYSESSKGKANRPFGFHKNEEKPPISLGLKLIRTSISPGQYA